MLRLRKSIIGVSIVKAEVYCDWLLTTSMSRPSHQGIDFPALLTNAPNASGGVPFASIF